MHSAQYLHMNRLKRAALGYFRAVMPCSKDRDVNMPFARMHECGFRVMKQSHLDT